MFKEQQEKETALSPTLNQQSSSHQPIRRMYTQRTAMQGESSEYTETYYDDDNKSRYSRMR